jgi:hypothetical protein
VDEAGPRVQAAPRSWRASLRLGALCVVILGGLGKFLLVVHEHYPIQHWLFFRYVSFWFWVGVLAFACWTAGGAVLGLLGILLPRAERALISFAVGLLVFFLGMFLGGLLGLYTKLFAFALPLAMIAFGAPRAFRRARRMRKPLVQLLGRPVRVRSWLGVAMVAFGAMGLLLAYIPTLTPLNIAADARWYHLVLAESYAASGGIVRSGEGSFVAAYPQLASIIYTWAFLLPRTTLFDRVEIAAHIEVMVFLWTLLGVAVLAARVVPRRRIGLGWVAMFLFPGLLLYDSSLSVAADHILAFWGPPILLMSIRAWERLDPRPAFLLAVALAGAVLTKYQAGCLVIAPIFALALRGVWLLVRSREGRARTLLGLGVAAASTLLFTSAHWLKNLLWYRDPFYPLLHGRLPSTPWSPDAQRYFDTVFRAAFWRPEGTLAERSKETFFALFTFSFEPHDWSSFHRDVPVFGSLFTLLTFCVPFLGVRRRLWALVGCTYAGIWVWYWASHQDRYLQALVPLMAATTAAIITLIWRSGLVARACVSLPIAAQIVWGGDVPFFPTHAFVNTTPYKLVADLLASGHAQNYRDRLRPFPPWLELGRRLPGDAKVLVHGDIGPLGLGRSSVTDHTGWQGGISYGRHTYASLHDQLQRLGVTHVVWIPNWGHGVNSIADDLVFYAFVARYVEDRDAIQKHSFARLGVRPADAPHGNVLVWSKVEGYAPGVYALTDLTIPGSKPKIPWTYPVPLRPVEGDPSALLPGVEYVVVPTALDVELPGFTQVMLRNKQTRLYRRN